MAASEGVLRFGPYRLIPDRRLLTCLDQPVPLSGRPFDLLVALVERRDRIVSKDELKSLVWPHAAVVEDHTLVVTLAAVRKALGSDQGTAKLVGTIPGRGYRFLGQVQAGDLGDERIAPGPSGIRATSSHLPTPPDRLVGREDDIATLLGRLPQTRLITLLGPGGIGKTRLAIGLAEEAVRHYPDGVWFVELAPLRDPRLVVETIGAMFGLANQAGRPACEVMTTFLRRKQLLLVLDNCEHLAEEIARLAEAITTSCPTVTLLVTSRERLSIAGEFTFQVPALATPDSRLPVAVEDAMRFSAVRLFVDRAASVLGSFALTAETAPLVAEICRRLDGLALAIELAVAGLELLKPADLLSHLDARFRLSIGGGGRSAQPRHQTLRATIDWSYDLLSGRERILLRRMSIFAGSFTVASAGAVAMDAAGEPLELIHLMLGLVDKSLVVPLPDAGGERRFRLLESTRAYGLEKLDADERTRCLECLVDHLIGRYKQGEVLWPTTATDAWREAYEADLENLRAALEWAFATDGDAARGLELVGHTQELWFETQLVSEQRRWLEIAEMKVDETTPPAILARLRLAAGRSAHMGGRQHLESSLQALDLFRQTDEPLYTAIALSQVGKMLLRPGDVAEAEPYLREGVARLRAVGPTKFLVLALGIMVGMYWFANDIDGARAHLEEAHDLALGFGDARQLEFAAAVLAELDFAAGRREEAIARARAVQAACRMRGSTVSLATVSSNLAGYLVAIGDAAGGREVAGEALRLALALGANAWVMNCFQHLALAAAIDREPVRAARLAGYSDAYFRAEHRTRQPNERSLWLDLSARLEQALSPAELARLLAEGAAWSEEDAVAVALA